MHDFNDFIATVRNMHAHCTEQDFSHCGPTFEGLYLGKMLYSNLILAAKSCRTTVAKKER